MVKLHEPTLPPWLFLPAITHTFKLMGQEWSRQWHQSLSLALQPPLSTRATLAHANYTGPGTGRGREGSGTTYSYIHDHVLTLPSTCTCTYMNLKDPQDYSKVRGHSQNPKVSHHNSEEWKYLVACQGKVIRNGHAHCCHVQKNTKHVRLLTSSWSCPKNSSRSHNLTSRAHQLVTFVTS